jgi:hypothetical protein
MSIVYDSNYRAIKEAVHAGGWARNCKRCETAHVGEDNLRSSSFLLSVAAAALERALGYFRWKGYVYTSNFHFVCVKKKKEGMGIERGHRRATEYICSYAARKISVDVRCCCVNFCFWICLHARGRAIYSWMHTYIGEHCVVVASVNASGAVGGNFVRRSTTDAAIRHIIVPLLISKYYVMLIRLIARVLNCR